MATTRLPGGTRAAGRWWTAGGRAGNSPSPRRTTASPTTGTPTRLFEVPRSLPRTSIGTAWLGWRSMPQAPSTNPAYFTLFSAGVRLVQAKTGQGTLPGSPQRIAVPAGARGLRFSTWCSSANGPGWCNWPRHHFELQSMTLELEELGAPDRVRDGPAHGRRGAPRGRAAVDRRVGRRLGRPPGRGSARRQAGRLAHARRRLPGRPAAAVPAEAARDGGRRHDAGRGRPASPAAAGHRRGRQPHARSTPARSSSPTTRAVQTPPPPPAIDPGTPARRRPRRRLPVSVRSRRTRWRGGAGSATAATPRSGHACAPGSSWTAAAAPGRAR